MALQPNTQHSISSLLTLKSELEALKEYQYGEHPSRILYISEIQPKDFEAIQTKIKSVGTIKSISSQCLDRYHFVLISYYDLRDSKNAFKMLQNKYNVSYAIAKDVLNDKEQNQGTIVVFNIEYSTSNEELKELFGKYGDIKEIRETPNKKHHKFIEYYDLRHAQKAIEQLNYYELNGRKIKIEPSRPGGIRQRLINNCIKEMNLPNDLIGLPPPEEMIKIINNFLNSTEINKEVETNCKKDEIIISLPKPTVVGEELSKGFVGNESVGTPHIISEENKNGIKGIGLNEGEDVDEYKSVVVIENIPITINCSEIIYKIEKCISCFYDQFFCLKQNEEYYKVVVRVTNKMVILCLIENFNDVFLEKDQDRLCKIHETNIQGKQFTQTLHSLLV